MQKHPEYIAGNSVVLEMHLKARKSQLALNLQVLNLDSEECFFFVVVVSSGHILSSKLFYDIHFPQSLTTYQCLRSVTYEVGLIKPGGRFIGILCSIKQGS